MFFIISLIIACVSCPNISKLYSMSYSGRIETKLEFAKISDFGVDLYNASAEVCAINIHNTVFFLDARLYPSVRSILTLHQSGETL